MAYSIVWGILSFVIGFLATFAYKFLSEYIPNRTTGRRRQIIGRWNRDDWTYIALGGLFTFAINPCSISHAIMAGVSWEAIFIKIYIIKKTQ
ncbi:MAG: hypothetical protein KAU20_05940 [Nanoarchaeota archaeon]|nr:hypothetical protein [Nanoarchaeota archaeon]